MSLADDIKAITEAQKAAVTGVPTAPAPVSSSGTIAETIAKVTQQTKQTVIPTSGVTADGKAYPTIRQGDGINSATLRPAVARWQQIIGVSADGKFGPMTASATKKWQASRGLVADGIVGPKSWSAALSKPVSVPVSSATDLSASLSPGESIGDFVKRTVEAQKAAVTGVPTPSKNETIAQTIARVTQQTKQAVLKKPAIDTQKIPAKLPTKIIQGPAVSKSPLPKKVPPPPPPPPKARVRDRVVKTAKVAEAGMASSWRTLPLWGKVLMVLTSVGAVAGLAVVQTKAVHGKK